jgi:hypothetical protein
MAFARRSDPVDVDGLHIPDLHAHPRLAGAQDLLDAFVNKLRDLERQRKILLFEQSLASATREQTRVQLGANLRRLRADAPAATQVPANADAASKAILDAMSVLRGEPAVPPLGHDKKIAAIDAGIDALDLAIREQTTVRDAIVGELTHEYAKQLKGAWDRLQLEFYRSAQEFSRNTRRVNDVRARIVAAGFRDSQLLMTPRVNAPIVLGYETDWNSEIAEWRRGLERMGILK